VRLPARHSDDADVIRARLRALLAEGARPGWVPSDLPERSQEAGDEAGDEESDEPGAWTDGPARSGVPDRVGEATGSGRHRVHGPAVRVDPGRPGARSLWVAAAAAVSVLLLWTWLQRPAAEPVPVDPPQPAAGAEATPPTPSAAASPPVGEVAQTSASVVVSVVGLVAEPGLVTLTSGARVADAIDAAGGLLPEADPASVNLAAVVADGQQVAVGVPGAAGAAELGPDTSGGGGGAVNLNTADLAALDGLPGIGSVLARRIVDHREQHGPFRRVDDLLDVPGIGPAILGQLSDAVTV
jgi:competence protein ComEA